MEGAINESPANELELTINDVEYGLGWATTQNVGTKEPNPKYSTRGFFIIYEQIRLMQLIGVCTSI